ncbi:MAG: helix-turn-helix domain-containing protein [Clostridium sp.]|nr:helix-turn-helix domain-containing protein [Clostridium sp.]MCM1398709.1 helix-turn-helix domain-containing protein [Clostridium sp.]MCM1458660.1 helix-turn-helix domain-containing protein [Bacteroides sp.]
MNFLKLSDNIAMHRRRKKITQDELAQFIGVTKASVSKWENGQSMPDIMLLPSLASFFDISIDELMGYEPYLSDEQIYKIYEDLKISFVEKTYAEVIDECDVLVKKYYSCYPFLFRMCALYLNHYKLAGDDVGERELLLRIVSIAEHILKHCKDIHVCNSTIEVKALADLLLGNTDSVVSSLGGRVNDKFIYVNNITTLIKAYQIQGNVPMANQMAQMDMYTDILSLVTTAIIYIETNISDRKVCHDTIERVEQVMKAYHINKLHPNTAAQFHFQAAIAYCVSKDYEDAVSYVEQFVNDVETLMVEDEMTLHGDEYFTMFDSWIKQFELDLNAPRDAKLVWNDTVQLLDMPVFEPLNNYIKFKSLKKRLEGGMKDGKSE